MGYNSEINWFEPNLHIFSELRETMMLSNNIYFIFCAQHMILKDIPPKKYIYFNLEQYFDLDNKQIENNVFKNIDMSEFKIFYKNALLVLDYNQENANKFHKSFGIYPTLFNLPILPTVNTKDIKQNKILFIGGLTERRVKILTKIQEKYPLDIHISNLLMENLHQTLQETKILLNIHAYPNAILERIRLNEAINYGCKIISEKPYGYGDDLTMCEKYKDVIFFIEEIKDNYDELFKTIENVWWTHIPIEKFQKTVSYFHQKYLQDLYNLVKLLP
jgi:hypothetical protein